jgi:hypothetical protein
MTATSAISRAYDAIDLSSKIFWSTTAAQRERSFAVLRAERPVSWYMRRATPFTPSAPCPVASDGEAVGAGAAKHLVAARNFVKTSG